MFANKVEIPPLTLFKYIRPDASKRAKLGNGDRGKKNLLTNQDVKFIGGVLARANRGNDGMSRKEAKDVIQDLNPNISREGACKLLTRRVMPENAATGLLKKTTQKVQATTSDRTNINLAQQYRWHRLVDHEYDRLRDLNKGRCKKSGKLFGEVMHHFIIGLDEMCLMSDQHGDLRVVAAAEKRNHEKVLQDGRVSITIVCTGTVAGDTGPTIFLLKGKPGTKVKKAFSDAALRRYGLAVGSTIIMTENAFMTNDAWEFATKHIVKCYRHLPYVREN